MSTKRVNQKYQQVDQDESLASSQGQFEPKQGISAKEYHAQRAAHLEQVFEYIKDKAMNMIWILAASVIVYESNFFKQVFENPYINRDFMALAEGLFGIFVGLQLYAAFILPYVYGINEEIEDYAPKVLYVAATAMLLFFFSFVIAVWPVWGWKTIPMLMVMFFGYISTSAFLPGKLVGGLASIAIFVGCVYSHVYIKHDGKWH